MSDLDTVRRTVNLGVMDDYDEERNAANAALDRIEAVVTAAREYETDFVVFDAPDGCPSIRPKTAHEKDERWHRLTRALYALSSGAEVQT